MKVEATYGLRILIVFSFVFLMNKQVDAQVVSHSFEEIDSLQEVEERTVVVFIHTDWCKFCQSMLSSTFMDKDLVKALNEKYYFVSFNGEQEEDVIFSGHTFKFKPTGTGTGVHELAEQLGTIDGTLTYPATCFMNKKHEILFQHNQFLSAQDFLKLLDAL